MQLIGLDLGPEQPEWRAGTQEVEQSRFCPRLRTVYVSVPQFMLVSKRIRVPFRT